MYMYKDTNTCKFILILPTQTKATGVYLISSYLYLLYSTPRILSLKNTYYDRMGIAYN